MLEGNLEFLLRLNTHEFVARIEGMELDWIPLLVPHYATSVMYRFVYRVCMNKQLPRDSLTVCLRAFPTHAFAELLMPILRRELDTLTKKMERGKAKIVQQDILFLRSIQEFVEFDPLILTGLYLNADKDTKLEILAIFYHYLSNHPFVPELIEQHGNVVLENQSMIMDFVLLFGKLNWDAEVTEMLDEMQLKSGNVGAELPAHVVQFIDSIKRKQSLKVSRQTLQAPIHEETIDIMSILAVHDLFPDLGHGFIQQCFVEYKDTETVIMKLLENDLPDYLAKLDRSMPLKAEDATLNQQMDSLALNDSPDVPPDLPPRQNLLSERKNVYDGDKYDIFSNQVDPKLVHIGKKECLKFM
jgi:hypothetical protein